MFQNDDVISEGFFVDIPQSSMEIFATYNLFK